MKDSLNVAIAGATGYVGLQLIKILVKHSKAKILYLCATKSIGKRIGQFDKVFKNKKLPKISKIHKIDWSKINILFTALPNGEAQKIAKILPNHVKLIDLSADFRLTDSKSYKKWYGLNHNSKYLINKAIYSISEFSREEIKNYKIISCPGCYPTSVQIPLIPLVKNKMIETKNIIIDSKSGYSGAGRSVHLKYKNKNLYKSLSAYGVGFHRHNAEIKQELNKYTKSKIEFIFTPHLSPMFRGILSTIYLDLNKNVNAKKIHAVLNNFYKKHIFVKILKFNSLLNTNDVINTNYCNISVCKSKYNNKIILLSTIDNLIKGGAGQGVQNMNILYNFDVKEGLK